jgi:hypothetical protein
MCWVCWSSSSTVAKPFGTRALVRSTSCWANFTCVCCWTRFGLRLIERPLRLAHQGFGLLERGFEIAGIHHRDHLARLDDVALVDKELGDAAGELGVDIDLIGFEPPVARGEAGRQAQLMLLPPEPSTPAAATSSSMARSASRGFRRLSGRVGACSMTAGRGWPSGSAVGGTPVSRLSPAFVGDRFCLYIKKLLRFGQSSGAPAVTRFSRSRPVAGSW